MNLGGEHIVHEGGIMAWSQIRGKLAAVSTFPTKNETFWGVVLKVPLLLTTPLG